MGFSGIGLRHIVDVDGQLFGFDSGLIDTTALLARARRAADSHLWVIQAGERFAIQPKATIRLSEDDVIFFETAPAFRWASTQMLAA